MSRPDILFKSPLATADADGFSAMTLRFLVILHARTLFFASNSLAYSSRCFGLREGTSFKHKRTQNELNNLVLYV